MFNKINIRCILVDHLQTLKNDNTNEPGFWDYCLFLFLPLVLPSVLLYFGQLLTDELITTIITILSIFVGLLLNVLVVIFDIVKKNSDKIKLRLIKETYSNISFAILLSIITIIPLLLCYIDDKDRAEYFKVLRYVFNGLSYYLLAVFFITLLMIVKRIHVVLSDEMKNGNH